MISFNEANLSQAARVYAIANTPLFLIHKLREDPAVHDIARSFSGEQILLELQRATVGEPQTPADYVRPYALLAALALKSDVGYLRAAARIERAYTWEWFDYIHRVLLTTHSPTTSDTMRAHGNISPLSRTVRTTSPVERLTMKARA